MCSALFYKNLLHRTKGERTMKKKVFMKIMSSITLLCLGAHAGLMIGKRIRKKKDEEWEGEDFVLINTHMSQDAADIYEDVETAFEEAKTKPVQLWLSDDVEDYMVLRFNYRENHLDSDKGVIVMSVVVFCEGVPLVIQEQALSFTDNEKKAAVNFIMSYINVKGE